MSIAIAGENSVLTLEKAQAIIAGSLAHAASAGFKPLAVAVLDSRGALKAFGAADGTSLRRGDVATGKAYGAVALGIGSRAIAERAAIDPSFVAAVSHVVGGSLVPVPGGVLIMAGGTLLGAVGASGDTSDNDEAAVSAGIEAAGFTARIR